MEQVDFWSNNPCGADGTFSRVTEHRYRIEPWLRRELRAIPSGLGSYLEIGCGQGADAYYICSQLDRSDSYTAIDYSAESVARASRYLTEARELYDLKVIPQIFRGDALSLDFDDNTFDFVYSNGVLHHTPDPQKSFDELFRVLKPGGHAKVFLYRRGSLKVGVAKLLRQAQRLGDVVFFQERFIYKLLRRKKSEFFGSMFLECFGVPWMEWYSEKELQVMFRKFSSLELQPYGFNLPALSSNETDGYNRFGLFYRVELTK